MTLDIPHGLDSLTAPGSPLGTLTYMSPEQARGEDVDERTDIFSLGALLYEMATGIAPFRGDTPAEIFGAILNSTPISPSHRNPRLPEDLDRIINKALQKEPSKRYRSVSEMASELSALNAKLYPAEVRNALLRPLYAVSAVAMHSDNRGDRGLVLLEITETPLGKRARDPRNRQAPGRRQVSRGVPAV